ncbi:hypothetical protein [Salinicola sp. CR57]|uniref:hypothetical protein n=1 Tax=Salinicola sp. CR57 TaxID=1949086 RepID=UPI000DA1300D|nr:hypothetical protein [Salinicola sp. CR57]
MAIVFTITDAGRAALIDPDNNGTNAVVIAEVELGSGRYAPTKEQTELQSPIKRVDTIAGQAVSDDTLHVTVQDETGDAYQVGEIGLFTETGVLFAVYSQDEWIIEKAAPVTLLLATDLIIESLDVSSITFGDAAFLNPPASETVQGVVEIATQDEVDAGTDRRRAIVPRNLKAFIDKVLKAYATVKQLTDHAASRDHPGATTSAQGMVELATYGETQDGKDNARAVTPAALNSRTSTTSRTGLVEMSTDSEALSGESDSVVPSVKQVRAAYGQYGLGATEVPRIDGGEGIAPCQFFYSSVNIDGLSWPIGLNISRSADGKRDVQLLIQSLGAIPRALIRSRDTIDPAAPFVSAELWHTRNMGSGSNLDADKLDGEHGSYYRDASNLNTGTVASARMAGASTNAKGAIEIATVDESKEGKDSNRAVTPEGLIAGINQFGLGATSGVDAQSLNNVSRAGFYAINSSNNDPNIINDVRYCSMLAIPRYGDVRFLYLGSFYEEPRMWIQSKSSTGGYGNTREVWHTGNMGSGSNLDAGKLEGQRASYYRDAGNINAGTLASERMFGATTSKKGAIEIATDAETATGSDGNRAATPSGVKAAINQFGLGTSSPPPTNSVDLLLGAASQFTAGSGGNAGDGWFEGYGPAMVMSRNALNTIVINGRGNRLAFKGSNNNADAWASSIWNELWHTGNMGGGSGLDADKLDGQHGSYYRDAGNLNAGTVSENRLPWASETARGILRRASDAEALDGSNVHGVPSAKQVRDAYQQYGLGLSGGQILNSLSKITGPGLYGIDSGNNDSNIPSECRYASALALQRYGDTRLAYVGNNGTEPRMWLQTTYNGTWGSTREVWHTGNMGSGSNLDADKLDGEHGSYYRDAGNLNTGTLSRSRLSGSYNINIDGKSDDSNKLGGQPTSYYRDAGNLNSGTLPVSRLGTGSSERSWVLDRIADADEYVVGTYAFLYYEGQVTTASRISGSRLTATSVAQDSNGDLKLTNTGRTMSGTWQACGGGDTVNRVRVATLFRRVS